MKHSIIKTSALTILLATLSIALVGCGTGPDDGGMRKASHISQMK